MKRFYAARRQVFGRKWALSDCANLRKFYTTIEESPPDSELRKYQLARSQAQCLIDFRNLTRPPRVMEYAYRIEGTDYEKQIPWDLQYHVEPPTIDNAAVTGCTGGCLPALEISDPTFGRPVEAQEGQASSSHEVVATLQHGTAPKPVRN